MVLHSTARVVLPVKWGDWQSSTASLSSLRWRPAKWSIHQKLLVVVFNAYRDKTPTYIASCITSYTPRRAFWSSCPNLAKDSNSKDENNSLFDYLEDIIENNVFPETIIEEELGKYSEIVYKKSIKWNETERYAILHLNDSASIIH